MNGSESAFPFEITKYGRDETYREVESYGLTKFEYYCGLAMAYLATDVRGNPADVAKKAVAHAEELLKAMEERNEKRN